MKEKNDKLDKALKEAQLEAERYRNLYCSIRATSNSDYERLKRKHILSHESASQRGH